MSFFIDFAEKTNMLWKIILKFFTHAWLTYKFLNMRIWDFFILGWYDKKYKMSKYIFKSFLKKEKKNIFEIDILMIPLQVDENDVLMLLIYICSYMYNLLEHFSVSEWMNHWLNKFLSLQASEKKIDSVEEDYKDSLPNHLRT